MKLLDNYNLSPEVQAYMRQHLVWQQLPKNTILFSKGQTCNAVYFIESGIARGFYDDKNGEDTTAWFVQSGDFVYSSYNILNRLPASESVQLLEASTVVSIPLITLDYIYTTYPETKEISNSIIEKHTQLLIDFTKVLRHQTTDQRIRWFTEVYPTIYERVQKQHIASYLGMCREAVSHALSAKHKK